MPFAWSLALKCFPSDSLQLHNPTGPIAKSRKRQLAYPPTYGSCTCGDWQQKWKNRRSRKLRDNEGCVPQIRGA